MGFEINWTTNPNDPVLDSPLYQKWSAATAQQVAASLPALKADIASCKMNREAAAVISYLSWVLRVGNLVA